MRKQKMNLFLAVPLRSALLSVGATRRDTRPRRDPVAIGLVEPLEGRLCLTAAPHATVRAAADVVALPRMMEYLDRGIVATRVSSSQAFVSWRSLALDPTGMGFNLYRSTNGATAAKLNASPLTAGTNYTDTSASSATASYRYYVRPVVGGVEQAASGSYTLKPNTAAGPLINIPLRNIGDYSIRHISVADLDGDGEYDYIVDRSPNAVVNEVATASQVIEAYKSDGTFLWVVDCGPNSFDRDNIEPGSSGIDIGNWDGVTAFDLDGDGTAEVMYRSSNGVVFGDGATLSYPSNNDIQFMSVLDGKTGAEKARIQLPTDYLIDGPLAASLGVGYLDGVHPSLVAKLKNRVGDGDFTQMFVAYDYNGTAITQRWKYNFAGVDADNGHNIRIVDVNGDGKDDVSDTAQVINSDGTLLYNMRYGAQPAGHGDRFFIGDLDPDRPGLERYAVQQNNPSGMTEYYADAATGEVLHAHYTTPLVDVGRGVVGDIDPTHRGMEYWSFGGIYNSTTPVAGQPPVETKIADDPNRPWPNFNIWWDGDVLGESLNNTTIDKWNPTTQGNDRLTTLYHYGSPYATSGEAPVFYGDIMGDWREEVIFEKSDHTALQLYTTQYASSTRLYTLSENPEYRNNMTVKGYLQSNMVDYYLGSGMATPPTPNIQVLSNSNAVPTAAAPAAATPNSVAGKTATLSVLGADDGGEAALTYTWSVAGPASVTFSANGVYAAKNTVATFTAAGTYIFTVSTRDAGGRAVLSNVKVVVTQTASTAKVGPAVAAIGNNSNQQFVATAYDQFGAAMSVQPTFTWSLNSGAGSINAAGLYTPTASPGTAVVKALFGSLSAPATVNVNGPALAAPINLAAVAASPSQINLTWTDSIAGEDSFIIEQSTDGTIFGPIGTANANATSFGATGLAASTTYFFRIRSHSANGNGLPSNVATVATHVSPLAWWTLNAPSGTLVADGSGNGHYGTTRNGPTWTAGRLGNALSFDGTDDYVELQNNLLNTAIGSVSLWVKTSTNFSNYAMLFYMADDTYGNGFGSQSELHLNFTSAEKLQLYIRGSAAGDFSKDVNIISAASYNDNAWHQVTATWTAGGSAVLYVDGTQVGSATDAPVFTFGNTQRTFLSRTANASNPYKGLMDDVRVYGTALTSAQAQSLAVVPPAPVVNSVVIGDGTVQRSTIQSLTVNFSQPVTLAGNAFTLTLRSTTGGAATTIPIAVSVLGTDGASYRITFTGNDVVGGSLADGRYDLLINATGVTSVAGLAMTANTTSSFHRLFGDSDGDAGVNIIDFNQFAAAFGTGTGIASYSSAFDYDGDRLISITDFNSLATRFGITI